MKAKKSLGQHWLFDAESLDKIADEAELTPQDTVLEIGPGLGPLTALIAGRAKQVIAVELDEDLAHELPSRVPVKNLRVLQGDILRFDLSQMPPGYKVVANVPYYLTSKIVRYLLESPTPPSLAVLLVQREVAQRLDARGGDMSILAVGAQFYARVSLGPIIQSYKFRPEPKVDSQVVIMRHRGGPMFTDVDIKVFFRVVKAGFGEKRKTLRNSLSGGLNLTKDMTEALLDRAGIEPGRRAETLALREWRALTKAFEAMGDAA
jgi:16S rRNA (adenine1518-N6/adenine1519-N6)-dimethyltransferase